MNPWSLRAAACGMVAAAVCAAMLTATPVPPNEERAVYRVVGEWEGRVAVFLPDNTFPEQVYDTWVSMLPTEDRRRLQDGIEVEDHAALTALLEDVTS